MNDVFPLLSTVALDEARPGSIVKIPRSERPLVGLVTADVADNGTRSIVLLNAQFQHRPPVIFARKWRFDSALCFGSKCEFDLDIDDRYIDWHGTRRWETSGAIVSIEDQLFIRAAITEEIFGGHELVNIRTGELFSGTAPNTLITMSSWSLAIVDLTRQKRIPLCEFKIAQQ